MNNINNTWEQPNDLVTNSADANAIRVSAEKKTPGTLIKDENNNVYRYRPLPEIPQKKPQKEPSMNVDDTQFQNFRSNTDKVTTRNNKIFQLKSLFEEKIGQFKNQLDKIRPNKPAPPPVAKRKNAPIPKASDALDNNWNNFLNNQVIIENDNKPTPSTIIIEKEIIEPAPPPIYRTKVVRVDSATTDDAANFKINNSIKEEKGYFKYTQNLKRRSRSIGDLSKIPNDESSLHFKSIDELKNMFASNLNLYVTVENEDEASKQSNQIEFNFYNEFYFRFKKLSNDLNESESNNTKLNENYFSLTLNDQVKFLLNNCVEKTDLNVSFIGYLLDPLLVDISNNHIELNNRYSQSLSCNSSNDYFYKFTIDFYKMMIDYKINLVNSNELFDGFLSKINDNTETNFTEDEVTLESHLGILKTIFSTNSLNVNSELNVDDLNATCFRIKSLLVKKLNFLNNQLKINTKNNEISLNFGLQLQKFLEENTPITKIELEKFKLLVNETDAIVNLLIKQCNKLANIENLIQIKKLSQSTTNEELDSLRQDLIQIQRKKDEAIFLKYGIDKRAINVKNFLNKYFSEDEMDEFQLFMNTKYANPLQIRHTKDHIELTKLQIKLLDEVNFKITTRFDKIDEAEPGDRESFA